MKDADVIAGSRVAQGAHVDRQQPFRRRLVGWPFIALTRGLMRESTHDVYCGFKLWSGTAAEAVFSRQRLDGWVFDAEVLALARRLGFRVREVGVAWADREGSKLSITEVLIPAVRELLAARRSVRSERPWTQRQRQAARERPRASTDAELLADPAEPTA
jgi:dolichyl-phosphate beta-glucosyltransferase